MGRAVRASVMQASHGHQCLYGQGPPVDRLGLSGVAEIVADCLGRAVQGVAQMLA